ncbi:MAG TPA: TRAP transporter small permease [Desulfobacteria bacterium]|nr:TRAP transporter small permease [Desulfobacteria bacterium]
MEAINRLIYKLVDWVKHLGGVALVGMMTITTLDVITRYFGHPIFGAVELVSFMATILLACAMPMTHLENGHVGVDLVVRLLSKRSQALIDTITGLLSLILFVLICWQCVLYAQTMKKTGEVSMSLQFPNYIFVWVVAVAFGVLGLAVLPQINGNLRTLLGKK